MRQITLDGRIGKGGAKVMKSSNGRDYVRFDIANDAFVDGTNKTDWFSITCFDPYIVSKKSEFLKQGRYVIVQGTIKSEVNTKNGKIWLNHYVTANNIELPSFGKREEKDEDEPLVSTFTGGTKSEEIIEHNGQVPTNPVIKEPQPQVSAMQSAPVGWGNDDDLPF